jgi:predicted RND superfamily exporter protein
MPEHAVVTARRMLRSYAAMFLVGLFAKGMGFVISFLAARLLGPTATCLIALMFSIAVRLSSDIQLHVKNRYRREAHTFRDDMESVGIRRRQTRTREHRTVYVHRRHVSLSTPSL